MQIRYYFAASAAALSLATVMAAPAHAQETTSSIRGSVTGDGAPLAGAEVKIIHTPSGTTATTTTDTGVAADSTMNNDDSANTSEEVDMAAGDGLEGMVMNFDGTAKTFGLNENDKNYNVSVTDTTTYEGNATTADEFFGTDRNDANVSVEGEINGESLVASKITLN